MDLKSKIQNLKSKIAGLLLLGLVLAPHPALAQEIPDTTQAARPDSVQAAPLDSARVPSPAGPPMSFRPADAGRIVVDTLPITLPEADVTGILAAYPSSFVYAFGMPGWPDAWSPYGLRPERVDLVFEALPYDDLITGRPRYDLLSLDLLLPVRVGSVRYGEPVAVLTSLRLFEVAQPLTELRYRAGADGLQAITVLHTQTRRATFFGRTGTLNVLGSYGGRAADGAYPGSDLRRERKLAGRIRFARPNWNLELLDYYARRRIGAQGGVERISELQAQVIHPDARRQTIRNDLSATLRARLLFGPEAPITLKAFWAAQTTRYAVDRDTLTLGADRYGLWAEQELPILRHTLTLRAAGWLDTFDGLDADSVRFSRSRWQVHAAATDTLRFGRGRAALEAGVHGTGPNLYPSLSADLSQPFGGLTTYMRGLLTGRNTTWAERYGFGPFLTPLTESTVGSVVQGEVGIRAQGRTFDAMIGAFSNQARRESDLYVTGEDTAAVFVTDEPVRRAGVTADFGWRRNAERGLYATFQPNLVYFLNSGVREGAVFLRSSLPTFHASGRVGARYLLFKGDLDLDVYLQGRFWSEMHSRTLHPPTGLLVLPRSTSPPIGPMGMLNLYVEASVRTATIFLAYENLLGPASGPDLYETTLLVPVYPLPEQRFRFGVYWPIQG